MEGVDQLGELGLAPACGHGQRSDRDPVSDPDARVPREQQVGKRVDQEVVRPVERSDQAAGALHLVVAQAGHHDLGQLVRTKISEIALQKRPKRLT